VRPKLVPFPQTAPLALILIVFLLLPMRALVVVSFLDYDSVRTIRAFEFSNYTNVLGSAVTWRIYLNTFRYIVIAWAVTAALGFIVAYVLAIEIRSRPVQMALDLIAPLLSGPPTSLA
jgi:putative spermidine/putrescine transport system permease protein